MEEGREGGTRKEIKGREKRKGKGRKERERQKKN